MDLFVIGTKELLPVHLQQIVDLPHEKEKWMEGNCTCPAFFKQYLCRHIIGMSIRLKYAKPPPAAKTVPIGEKRKRGRNGNMIWMRL